MGMARSDEPKAKDKASATCNASCVQDKEAIARGREIFLREWIAGDPRSHGGDGLGPVYNDSSCIACHNMGGVGGGGPNNKNIDILSASLVGVAPKAEPTPAGQPAQAPKIDIEPLAKFHSGFRSSKTVVLHKFGIDPNYESWRQAISAMNGAGGMAFGNDVRFANQPSFFIPSPAAPQAPPAVAVPSVPPSAVEVLTESQVVVQPPSVEVQQEVQTQQQVQGFIALARNSAQGNPSAATNVGPFVVRKSQRNPSALFGMGLIDSIPDSVILANAEKVDKNFPETKGRAARLKDGRVGKFGWKGQIPGVQDFVLNACANEVGLEVPDHHQALVPQAPEYKAGGFDLTRGECDDLIAFVRSIPAPTIRKGSTALETEMLSEGKALLASVGCTSCHSAKLGDVEGIYSDLLIHDMGQELADAGSYGDPGSDPSDGDDDPFGPAASQTVASAVRARAPWRLPELAVQEPVPNVINTAGNAVQLQPAKLPRGAMRQEWRTPPLWGVRDSGPYMHDGRAQTLQQAISMHGGQATRSMQMYFALSPKERAKIEVYLKALAAPSDTLAQVQ